jgi:hypothetical protein
MSYARLEPMASNIGSAPEARIHIWRLWLVLLHRWRYWIEVADQYTPISNSLPDMGPRVTFLDTRHIVLWYTKAAIIWVTGDPPFCRLRSYIPYHTHTLKVAFSFGLLLFLLPFEKYLFYFHTLRYIIWLSLVSVEYHRFHLFFAFLPGHT